MESVTEFAAPEAGKFPIRTITPANAASNNQMAMLKDGVTRRLTIVWRPMAGNDMYYYDEDLRLINSALGMAGGRRLIYTNVLLRYHYDTLEGLVLFDRDIRVFGYPRGRSLQLCAPADYHDGCPSMWLNDEYSLFRFAGEHALIEVAEKAVFAD